MISGKQQVSKRLFDLFFSIVAILITIIPLCFLILISSIYTSSIGVFFQNRVGRGAKLFVLYKVKTMREFSGGNIRLTPFGKFLRRTKLDELPQLFNVLFGSMSVVGPRPDIQGYADLLENDDRIILSVKPGITGPATLKFANEELLLSEMDNPKDYNDKVIWPEKIKINRKYVENWSLVSDIKYVYLTIYRIFIK